MIISVFQLVIQCVSITPLKCFSKNNFIIYVAYIINKTRGITDTTGHWFGFPLFILKYYKENISLE